MDVKNVVEIRKIVDLLDEAVFGHEVTDHEGLKDVAIEAANRLEKLVQGRGHG